MLCVFAKLYLVRIASLLLIGDKFYWLQVVRKNFPPKSLNITHQKHLLGRFFIHACPTCFYDQISNLSGVIFEYQGRIRANKR